MRLTRFALLAATVCTCLSLDSWNRSVQAQSDAAALSGARDAMRTHPESLIEACRAGDLEQLLKLLQAGMAPNSRDKEKMTPLCQACMSRRPLAVLYLIAFGADVDFAANGKRTPLHCTCDPFNPLIAKLLLDHGADVMAQTADGDTAIDLLMRQRHAPNDAEPKDTAWYVEMALEKEIKQHLRTLKKLAAELEEMRKLRRAAIAEAHREMSDRLAHYGQYVTLSRSKWKMPYQGPLYDNDGHTTGIVTDPDKASSVLTGNYIVDGHVREYFRISESIPDEFTVDAKDFPLPPALLKQVFDMANYIMDLAGITYGWDDSRFDETLKEVCGIIRSGG